MNGNKERTKKAILDAFNERIAREDFSRISVAEICRGANVSAATFYRYFSDKYDVMNENYRRILFACASRPDVHGYRDLYYQLYSFAQGSLWRSIRYSFRSEGINSLRRFVAQYSYAFAEAITRQNRGGKGYTEVESMQCRVFCDGIGQMYEDWTFGRYHIPPDEAADALCAIMPPTLRDYWLVKPLRPEDVQMSG